MLKAVGLGMLLAICAISIAMITGSIAYQSGFGRGAESMNERLRDIEIAHEVLREDLDRYRVAALKASEGSRAANELKITLAAIRRERKALHVAAKD